MASSEPMDRGPIYAVADPAPLGLAGFALTTFMISVYNANWAPNITWVALAFFYGGLAQLLAGMWEFRNRNVFGATAFGSYGAFWLSLGGFFLLANLTRLGTGLDVVDALGWFVLAFAIFNSYMMLAALRVSIAVFGVFFTLEITEILLAYGYLQTNTSVVKWGGYIGVVTAAVAWYTSFAGVANSLSTRPILPVGAPLWRDREPRPSAPVDHRGAQPA